MASERKFVVAVDVDEVLGQYVKGYVAYWTEKTGKALSVADFSTYRFWEITGGTREEAMADVYVYHDTRHFKNLEVVPGAKEALDELAALPDVELHVVTSRQTEIADATREWLAAHFPGAFGDRIHLGNHYGLSDGPKVSKGSMCKTVGARVLIDDSTAYAVELAEAGTEALLFDLDGSYGWNQDPVEDGHPLITRARSWRDVVTRILELRSASALEGVPVMTFNMRTDTDEDADRNGRDCRWAARRELFTEVVLRELPEVLGVQEAMPNQVRDLTGVLEGKGYTCLAQPRDGPESEGVLLAVRSPWRVDSSGAFWLAVETPEVPGSKAVGAKHPRVAQWASLRREGAPALARRLLVVNTHFDHPTTEAAEGNRVRSAEQIVQFLERWPGWPAVVMLDANAEPGAPAHNRFMSAGLTDSWAECHAADGGRPTTFHLFQGPDFAVPSDWSRTPNCEPGTLGPSGSKTCHIDWVLHSATLRATSCEIDRTTGLEGAMPSDHFAVLATLRAV